MHYTIIRPQRFGKREGTALQRPVETRIEKAGNYRRKKWLTLPRFLRLVAIGAERCFLAFLLIFEAGSHFCKWIHAPIVCKINQLRFGILPALYKGKNAQGRWQR